MGATQEIAFDIIRQEILMEATAFVEDVLHDELLELVCNHCERANYQWYFVSTWLFDKLKEKENQKLVRTKYGCLWAVDQNKPSTGSQVINEGAAPAYPYKKVVYMNEKQNQSASINYTFEGV